VKLSLIGKRIKGITVGCIVKNSSLVIYRYGKVTKIKNEIVSAYWYRTLEDCKNEVNCVDGSVASCGKEYLVRM